MPLRFRFIPNDCDTNAYSARMEEILGHIGSVSAAPHSLFMRNRFDAAFVSWYDNRILAPDGTVSPLRFCKVVLRTLALRAQARKLIFIRHNRMPHATKPSDRVLAERMVDLYERWLFDCSLIHSPEEAGGTRLYCPHPLYKQESTAEVLPPQLAAFNTKAFYVVFGRIEPYKQLERLIQAFPKDKQLVICGRCSDPDYLARLTRVAPGNVTVLHGFIPDAHAQWLIRRSQGIVISHASDDMIVSASFFYAMSLAQRVFAVATPFLRWASATLGDDVVFATDDLEALCRSLAEAPSGEPKRELEPAIEALFGDHSIARHVVAALERVGLDVRVMESSSGLKSHAVCSSSCRDCALCS
jgi:glycosyltransferase involved in cell wall biosynthesis